MARSLINMERLIKEVEKQPCVWNIHHCNYNDKQAKAGAWQKICQVFYPHDAADKVVSLQKKWKSARDYYAKQKKQGSDGNGSGKKRKYIYFDMLCFLESNTGFRSVFDETEEPCGKKVPDEASHEDNFESAKTLQEESIKIERTEFYPTAETSTKPEPEPLDPEPEPEQLSTGSKIQDIDEDEMFLLSLLPSIRKLTPRQKMDFKIEVMEMSSKKHPLTIRNFRGLPQVSSRSIEEKWALLEAEIVAIFNSSVCSRTKSLEELFRIAEDLYTLKYSPLLSNLQELIENYLNQKLDVIVCEEGSILETIDHFWTEFCGHIKTVKNIFLYYDRSPKIFKYNTVQSIGMGLFATIIILNPLVKKKIIEEMLIEIEAERCFLSSMQRVLLKSLTDMFNVLQIYEDVFVGDFLKSTEYFYENEGTKIIQMMDVPQYLSHVNHRISQEQERVRSYLNKNTEGLVLDIVYKRMVENHIAEILTKGFDDLIDKCMYEELVLVYKLFQKISNGTKHLITYLKDYIIKKGTAITDVKNEKNMIQDLLDLQDNFDKTIALCFDDKKEFRECVRVAFKNFINNCRARSAQLLAKYLDNKLRGKDITDEELEIILTKVIKLFKHIQGKDIFEAFYKKLLAKRLLLGKSANQDAENSMISKLREECGSAFTSNIEGMFQDINLSKSINTSFKQKLKNQGSNPSSDFSVNVLTSSYWPNYPNYDVNLPCELVAYQQKFQKFYLGNHSGRKLLWQPSLSHCLIRASFDCGYKELQVSLFQAIVLLPFDTISDIGFKEIQEFTNLEKLELKRTLLSLVYGRAKILLKAPKTREIEEDDVFTFNNLFTDKLFRVKINQIQLQDSSEDEKETEKNVLVDRQFQIDAAIVRIMKNKKTIKHYMLVRELYKILEIPVNQTDLKKRIELLIEREYMERDKDNKSSYIYIA